MSRSRGTDRAGSRIAFRYRFRPPGQGGATEFPTLRLAKLAKLRHPMSVDLYVDSVIAKARIVVIRCLGGLDYWRYGVERASAAARAHGVALAVLPGDDRPDRRLDAFSTVSPELSGTLDAYFRAGGPENLRRM
ncbi:MAG TPA: cobaltochelatase subunit CobN, partial [Methylobacterium sp.]